VSEWTTDQVEAENTLVAEMIVVPPTTTFTPDVLSRLGPVLAWQPTQAKSWSLRSLLLQHVRRRVGSGKHKSGSISS
jgi:hypothetical protein